jgi:hypothetical protein
MSPSLDLALDRWLADEAKPDELILPGGAQKRFSPPSDRADSVQRDASPRDFPARFARGNDPQFNLQNADLGDGRMSGMIAPDQVDAFEQLRAQDGRARAGRRAPAESPLGRAP